MNQKTILITGGCGYLGAHLLRLIAEDRYYEGVRVRILDNLSSGSINALMNLPSGPRYEFMEGDILAPGAVRAAMKDVGTVIHLAALVRTPFAFDQPSGIHQVNHWGTIRLLEHCIDAGVPRFLYASSVSVYGPGGLFDEQAKCRPIGPYSCSKHEAERAVLMANDTNFGTTVLRMATLYGGKPQHVRFDAIANRLVYLAGTNRSLTVYGQGTQTRPLVHVRDAARALLWAHQQDNSVGEVYNVAESSPTIESVALLIQKLRPTTPLRYTDQDYREHLSLAVHTEKIYGAGWQSSERLENGLNELLAHFHNLSPIENSAPELTEFQC
ncbi:NAD-dependent epimerase/dehydratase family protein [Gammaproteobacteria bacterium]